MLAVMIGSRSSEIRSWGGSLLGLSTLITDPSVIVMDGKSPYNFGWNLKRTTAAWSSCPNRKRNGQLAGRW